MTPIIKTMFAPEIAWQGSDFCSKDDFFLPLTDTHRAAIEVVFLRVRHMLLESITLD